MFSMKPIAHTAFLSMISVLAVCASEEPAVSHICDLLRDSARYEGTIVRVRGEYVSTDEVEYLRDASCAAPVKTEGVEFLPGIALAEAQDKKRLKTPAKFETDRSGYRELNAKAAVAARRRLKLFVTVTGRVDGFPWFRVRKNTRDTPYGYGHGNSFPVQIVVMSLSDIVVGRSE